MCFFLIPWYGVCDEIFSSVLRMHLPANNFRNYSVCLAAIAPDSSRPHGLKPARLLCPWGLSRQESWSGLPCILPGDLPNPRTVPRSPALQADSLPFEPPGKLRNYLLDSIAFKSPAILHSCSFLQCLQNSCPFILATL